MADLLIANGDVVWDGDDIVVIDGNEDIKQQAYLRSITDVGESVFYPSYGSKIFLYLGKPYTKDNKGFIEQAARNALLAVEGVDEVLSIELKAAPRKSGLSLIGGNDGKERMEFYIHAEYKTNDGKTLKGALAYVAE